MLSWIVQFSVKNKLLIILSTLTIAAFGIYAFLNIPLGAVPDITNNQVQIITVSPNLATQDVEQFITYPIELEMSNLQGIKEIRSISKFGISLVTLVFDDKIGTYLPRQLIAEKLQTVAEKIPEGFGKPEMGPITTGLGEIYQYVLDVKPGYENRYSVMDLRTMQDWFIRRQLAGINGVVEINSWGGYLKQYEVAVNPDKLYEYNITLSDVYKALVENNSIAGGAYIEKNNQSYFIRGDGLIKSIDEILKIVVKTNQSIPILIGDIATIRVGYATRFGAITANGEGEKVLGQIMMLKGANSNEVINEVKQRIEEIQKKLPEGVYINPINDRSELIAKTTFTVVENLILGSIIVFLIVTLFLGNIRSALIISSLIPLSLLFTISVMYLVGIDVNLMSLGALDFGVIIDGAVIIVEYLMVQFGLNSQIFSMQEEEIRNNKIDQITYESTYKMTNSAIFGQLIVLIVFIPIYVLSGVEGKMFRPMAMSFSFALVGAILFGFTWVPVISSIFLRPANPSLLSKISKRFIQFLYSLYEPVIKWAYHKKVIVWGITLVIFIFSLIIFFRMGGEFVPTLDEGDFVIQPIIKSGTSLTRTIELTTKMENILLKNFPNEVEKVASRIGAAEVPTDPMGMEEVDMIIKLKPRSQWKVTKNKEELANLFKQALSVIPGVDYEFTQPIEMRFNELITGVRSDLAIKIFGEDIDELDEIAQKIKTLIQDVPGAADISVEKTVGLPQILVKYNRQKIAHYGINIKELNDILSMAFGGSNTGLFFEGEKRFDIVVRLPEDYRKDIEDVRNLPVYTIQDRVIPLSELATIEYYYGPAKISHESTHRRIVVNVNVRNRDLKSVVGDIHKIIDQHIKLPEGYYITYGGQFENLQNALNRLIIAVPVALLLIFIFIHFALRSLLKAAMVFIAVPMAVVGGIFLLWLRDMPFSISAGVGFIALFGIAVMNGIVLIEHLDELEKQGIKNIKDRVIMALKDRFRPVLLTASSAAFGFLPMAISTSAGAEVQRPLATVVIGGLITSTLLTLVALPLLYSFLMSFERIQLFPFKIIKKKMLMIVLFISLSVYHLSAQQTVNLNTSIEKALSSSLILKYNSKITDMHQQLVNTAFDINKTQFYLSYDENNVSLNGYPLSNLGVRQTFNFPSYYFANYKWLKSKYQISDIIYQINQRLIAYKTSLAYINVILLSQKLEFYSLIDSLNSQLVYAITKSVDQGYSSKIDLINARFRSQQVKYQLSEVTTQYQQWLQYWQWLIDDSLALPDKQLPELDYILADTVWNIYYRFFNKQLKVYDYELKLEKRNLLPDIFVEYFNSSNAYSPNYHYFGYEAGIAIPIVFNSQLSKIKAAKLKFEAYNYDLQYKQNEFNLKKQKLVNSYLRYYDLYKNIHKTANDDIDELFILLQKNLNNGNVNFYQFIQSIDNLVGTRLEYYDILQKIYDVYYKLKYGIYEDF